MEGLPLEGATPEENTVEGEPTSLEPAGETFSATPHSEEKKGGIGKKFTQFARAAAFAGAVLGGEAVAGNELHAQSPNTIEMTAPTNETGKGKWARDFLQERIMPFSGNISESKVGDYIQFTVPMFLGHYKELTQSDTSAMKEALRKYTSTDLIEINSALSTLSSLFDRWHINRQISERVYSDNKQMLDFMHARIQWAQHYMIATGNNR